MNKLSVGFSRVNITPMMGIEMYGYYSVREAEGMLDELEINAVALACAETRALLISVDHCGIPQKMIAKFRKNISEMTGVPVEGIYISATHIHTGPYLVDREGIRDDSQLENIINTNPSEAQKSIQQDYYRFFYHKIADAAKFALEDLKPATMSWGRSVAPNVSFIRRYRMKNGTIRTNPGVHNPEIVGPVGTPDEEIGIVQFARENADNILLVSFGNHPDVVGGKKISADWPGHTRRILEKAVSNMKCVFFTGTMGDVNHINVNRKDYEFKGRYEHACHIGQVVAGGVLQVLGCLKPEDKVTLRVRQRVIRVPSNMPQENEIAEARHICQVHAAGEEKGKYDTATVAKAARMMRLEHGPSAFDMTLSAVAVGNVVLLGIPGQHFACAGLEMKKIPGWDMILPTSQTNGAEGYFPPMAGYEEGGYEAVSSNFKAGVSEQLIAESVLLLTEELTPEQST